MAAPVRNEGSPAAFRGHHRNEGRGCTRVTARRPDKSALFRAARTQSVSSRTGPHCDGPDLSFCQFRSFLRHEGVAHRDAPIEVAEVGGLDEFSQFVVFGCQFLIMLRLTQKIAHGSFPKTNPHRHYVGTKSGGPMAHLCGPSNTQGYPRCPLFFGAGRRSRGQVRAGTSRSPSVAGVVTMPRNWLSWPWWIDGTGRDTPPDKSNPKTKRPPLRRPRR
jgi:hypothetical protein